MKIEKLINGGCQNKLPGVCKNHEKINVSPHICFEPESRGGSFDFGGERGGRFEKKKLPAKPLKENTIQ